MKAYIEFMKASCLTLFAIFIVFGLCSWRAYNKMMAKRFKWECYWKEVREDEYLRRLEEKKSQETAIEEKRKAMYDARTEKLKARTLEQKHK